MGLLLLGCDADAPADERFDEQLANSDSAVTIPFTFPDSQVVFEVSIDGKGPFQLILDTAVNPSVIDLETARALELPMDEALSSRAAGVGDARRKTSPMGRVIPTRVEGLSIGGSDVATFDAVAMDLSPFSEQVGRPLHGALGYSFLKSRAVRIDYPASTITFLDSLPDLAQSESGRAATNAIEFPMVLVGTDVLIDSVSVNGRLMSVLLDTGASPALTISSTAAERLGLNDLMASAEAGLVRGAGGTAQVFRAIADSISAGPLSSTGVRVTFASWLQQADGLLGNGFLKDFVLTLDYVGERVRIERPASDS